MMRLDVGFEILACFYQTIHRTGRLTQVLFVCVCFQWTSSWHCWKKKNLGKCLSMI